MQVIRVGVVGLGQIAQIMHLPYLRLIPGFEIAALCDLSPTLVEQVGDLYGVRERYTSAQEMIASADIDAVVVCTTFDHADIALAAIERGKHVLVEKPLCESPSLAREIAAAGDRAGVKVMVAYMKRYDPGFIRWQEHVRSLQDIRLVRVHDFCHNNSRVVRDAYDLLEAGQLPEQAASETAARAESRYRAALWEDAAPHMVAGYKLMLGLGVHDMTILRGSFGDPHAVLFTDIATEGPPITVSVLDYGSFRCTWTIGFTDTKFFDEELALWTTDEIVRLRFPSPYLKNAPTELSVTRTVGEETTTTNTIASYQEAFHNELLHFYDCIVHDRRPLTDAWEGARDIELLLEIVRKARSVESVQR